MNLLFTALYNLFSGSFEGLAEPSESPEMLLQNCRSFSQNGKRCCKIAWSLPETGNVVAKSQEAFPSRETLSQNCTKPSQVGKRCCKIAGSLPKSGNIVAKLHEAFRRAENGADFGIRKNSRKFEAKKNMVLSEKEKEFLRAHRRDQVPLWHAWVGALLCPVLFSGVVELLQAYCTTYRGGDWLDFAANAAGALLASGVAQVVRKKCFT